MQRSKKELETLICQTKTVGTFTFDEVQKCFTSDVEIVLGLVFLSDGMFESAYYFFDGYEVALDDDKRIAFNGPVENAVASALESWNEEPEVFMGYPIIYTNVSCEIAPAS